MQILKICEPEYLLIFCFFGLKIFVALVGARRRCATQPVIDSFTKAGIGDGSNRNLLGARGVSGV